MLSDYTIDALQEQQSLEFMKWLSCLWEKGLPHLASQRYLERWPKTIATDVVTKSIAIYQKAAVAPATTTTPTWAAELVGVRPLADAFVAIARMASLLKRIPSLRRIPFATKVPTESSGASFGWTGENLPKKVTRFSFSDGVTLSATKAAGVIVVTEELVRLVVPGSELALRDTFVNELAAFVDQAFLNPTLAPVANVNPGGIAYGTTPIAGTGNLQTDVASLLAAFYAGRPAATEAVLVMTPALAARLAGPTGGSPVGMSYNVPIVPSEVAGANVFAIDPRGVLVADAGIAIDVSRDATIEMVDNPAAPTGATVMTSLWQTNLVGFLCEQQVNWSPLAGAARYLAST